MASDSPSVLIELHSRKHPGYRSRIDAEDYDRVSQHRWRPSVWKGYVCAVSTIEGQIVRLHHFVSGKPAHGLVTDHINGDSLDNRKSNHREIAHLHNVRNRNPSSGGSSIWKGVHWHKQSQKWAASIRVLGERIHLGLFDSEIDAAFAYDEASREHHGEFGRANFLACPIDTGYRKWWNRMDELSFPIGYDNVE